VSEVRYHSVLEADLEAWAARLGLVLQRDPAGYPGRPDEHGYRLLNRRTNVIVAGAPPWDYTLDLEEVADELRTRERRAVVPTAVGAQAADLVA
jgi:hypothetical protein